MSLSPNERSLDGQNNSEMFKESQMYGSSIYSHV
jgi:hypothetical protein